jgi:hypothetical protein
VMQFCVVLPSNITSSLSTGTAVPLQFAAVAQLVLADPSHLLSVIIIYL